MDTNNLSNINLTDIEYKAIVNNLNDFIQESEELMYEERIKDMGNMSSYNEAFPNLNSKIELDSSIDFISGDIKSESSDILESLPLNSGDKTVLQALEESGLLNIFASNNKTVLQALEDSDLLNKIGLIGKESTITPEVLNNALNNYKDGNSSISDAVTEDITDTNYISLENGQLKINYTKLLYHGNKIYEIWENHGGDINYIATPLTILSSVYGYRKISSILEKSAFPKMYENPETLKKLNLKAIDPLTRAKISSCLNGVVTPLILLGICTLAYKKSLLTIENNIIVNQSSVLESISFLGIFSRISMSWFIGFAAILIYIIKIYFPSIAVLINSISFSQFLLYWTCWILLFVLYLLYTLYTMHIVHAKIIYFKFKENIIDERTFKFIPKFILNDYIAIQKAAQDNYLPTFETYLRLLIVSLIIVSINIIIYIVIL